MNKLSIFFAILSCAAFSALAWIFFADGKDNAFTSIIPNYTPVFSKKIDSSVKVLTDGENIFAISYDLKLFAFDKNGTPIFEKKLSKKSYPQAFTYHNNTIYIGTDDGDIISVSPNDGRENWSANIGEKIAGGFGFDKELVLFGAFDKRLHAFKTDGTPAFSFKSADAINGRIETKNGVAYFGNCAGEIEAVDISKQESIWKKKAGSHIPLAPIVANDSLIVSDFQGGIIALNIADGTQLWKNENAKTAVETQIEAYGDAFLFADKEGGFHIASAKNGTPIKSIFTGQKRMELCVADNTAVIALADGRIKAIDLTSFDSEFDCDLQIRIDSVDLKNGILAILDADSTLHVFLKQ